MIFIILTFPRPHISRSSPESVEQSVQRRVYVCDHELSWMWILREALRSEWVDQSPTVHAEDAQATRTIRLCHYPGVER
ncbi:hypothetical protein [Thioalkalivibrio thiocyanodenitrificans]|uniref:hypothetical protein n=1 Tax=Thioalkalivibrio thiocyanodenitrificans TaxID=243063 RepID=UPI0003693553|nr:hypothetical protein [Thioalkalivibrio thiocyanodenitrificans]